MKNTLLALALCIFSLPALADDIAVSYSSTSTGPAAIILTDEQYPFCEGDYYLAKFIQFDAEGFNAQVLDTGCANHFDDEEIFIIWNSIGEPMFYPIDSFEDI